jgi:hypothetical protein
VPKPAILKPEPLWTGKQVFTMFVPDVSLIRTSAWVGLARFTGLSYFAVKTAIDDKPV